MKLILFVVGAVILTVALLDEFDVPVEIPTSNNWVNAGIGVGIMGISFIGILHKKGK